MNNSETVTIGTHEVLGTLTYKRGVKGAPPGEFEGWVRRSAHNQNMIVARRFYGRNWWQLTSYENVISFEPKVRP